MSTPSGDDRVSKKQMRVQQSSQADSVSSAQTAPIGSGHSCSLTPSKKRPAPISPHFQAPKVRLIAPGGHSRRHLLPPLPTSGSGAPRRQLLAADQFPDEAQGNEKTSSVVPSQRIINSLRGGPLATSRTQKKPSV